MDGLVATPDQETPVLPKETTRQHAVMSNSEITFEPHTHKYTSHIPPSHTRMHKHTAHTHANIQCTHAYSCALTHSYIKHKHTHTHTLFRNKLSNCKVLLYATLLFKNVSVPFVPC